MAKSEGLSRFPIVFIRWRDHNSDHEDWTKIEDIEPKPIEIDSCGFLIKEDESLFTLALNVGSNDDDSECASIINILKECVIKKRIIKRAKKV